MPQATRYDREVRRVVFKSHETYRDVKLGDLRKVVEAAEGMGDDAEVTVENLTKHWQRADETRKARTTSSQRASSRRGCR